MEEQLDIATASFGGKLRVIIVAKKPLPQSLMAEMTLMRHKSPINGQTTERNFQQNVLVNERLHQDAHRLMHDPMFGARTLFLKSHQSQTVRCFGSIAHRLAPQLPPRIKVKDGDLVESFLKGSGPGGQKINKTASAVQLKHIPTGIIVKSQATRSRSQNREIARQLIADRIEEAEKGPKSRTALMTEIKRKKKASKTKKSRRKYKGLESQQEDSDLGDDAQPVDAKGSRVSRQEEISTPTA